MVFEPTGGQVRTLLGGNHDVLPLPVSIEIGRSRPLTTRMWEGLFEEMDAAALSTDLRLYENLSSSMANPDRGGFDYIRQRTGRFVITSIGRGSILVGSAVFLAAAGVWFFKEFIKPGWDKSESKAHWDDAVAGAIDKAVPILKEQIDYRVIHGLKRLKIRRVTIQPPDEYRRHRLADNTTPVGELTYDKSTQIPHQPKE